MPNKLYVYICTDHEGHHPVGVASVIIAEHCEQARELLVEELKKHGLVQAAPCTIRRINSDRAGAYVLRNGDY